MTPSVCASLSLKVAAPESGAAGASRSVRLPRPAVTPGPSAHAFESRNCGAVLCAFCAAQGRLALRIAMTAAALRYPSLIITLTFCIKARPRINLMTNNAAGRDRVPGARRSCAGPDLLDRGDGAEKTT
jgi:hypothetical protein